jgi:hypothetical protein
MEPLSRITSIGAYFLSGCSGLTSLNLGPLSNVLTIGRYFLSGCSGLTSLNLEPLSNVQTISHDGYFFNSGTEYFLSNCIGLKTVLVGDNEYLLEILNCNIPNVEVLRKDRPRSFKEDTERIKSDKQFTKEVLTYLKISYTRKTSKKYLVRKLQACNKKYNRLPNNKTLVLCRNDVDPISLEELKTIPAERLVLIEEIHGMYHGFDVVPLKYLCKEGNFCNPLTTNRMCKKDVDKILNADMRKIKYFM